MKTINTPSGIKILPVRKSNSWTKNWTEQVQFLKVVHDTNALVETDDYCYYLTESERI
jgi:hypothetical protein